MDLQIQEMPIMDSFHSIRIQLAYEDFLRATPYDELDEKQQCYKERLEELDFFQLMDEEIENEEE